MGSPVVRNTSPWRRASTIFNHCETFYSITKDINIVSICEQQISQIKDLFALSRLGFVPVSYLETSLQNCCWCGIFIIDASSQSKFWSLMLNCFCFLGEGVIFAKKLTS